MVKVTSSAGIKIAKTAADISELSAANLGRFATITPAVPSKAIEATDIATKAFLYLRVAFFGMSYLSGAGIALLPL